jgi:hypothetical protein
MAPYRKSNTKRFGAVFLNELRDAINIDYGLPAVPLSFDYSYNKCRLIFNVA